MRFEDHLDFLDLLSDSMGYAIDEESEKVAGLSINDFFTRLYTHFSEEDESAVQRAITKADSFTLIAAPSGGGKSTLLHNNLRNARSAEMGYFLFDFKHHYDGFYNMKNGLRDKANFIHRKLKEALDRDYLKYLDVKMDFIFNALQMFFPDTLQFRILKWRAANNNPDIGKDMNVLRTIFLKDFEAQAEELKAVMSQITCAQMIRVIKQTKGLKKFLLVIDNVDRVPAIDQPILFSVAIDIHHAGAGEFGTIVAVRNRNIMRYEEAGSQGNVITVVSLTTHIAKNTQKITMGPPTPEFASSLLEKRQDYVRQIIDQQKSMSAKKSAEIFVAFKPFINTSLIEERIYNLANHSYRDMLTLHTGFVRYLFRLVGHGSIINDQGKVQIDNWRARSYLYRWMYATHDPNHQFLLDIVSKYGLYLSGAFDEPPLLCDLELVILAWLARRPNNITRVEQLLRAFRRFGIEPFSILNCLYKLYSENPLHRHVELGKSEERVEFEAAKRADCRVTLTPLGREFVKDTITKFEFLHQCLAFPNVVEADSQDLLEKIQQDMDGKVAKVFKFLQEMKDVHSYALAEIQEHHIPKHAKWEEHYRDNYCIRGDLILERIVRSHLNHLKAHYPATFRKWKPEYERLLTDYYQAIKSVRKVTATLYGL